MRAHRSLALPAAALFMLPLTSCTQEVEIAPPEIVYGEDMCAECNMIISDDRYAAAIIRDSEDGGHQAHAFDDIGCMFDFERSRPDQIVRARYVQDYSTKQWTDSDSAWYVHSPELLSPMAFGVGAASTREGAVALNGQFKGDLLQIEGLRTRADAGRLSLLSFDDDTGLDGTSTQDHDD